MNNKQCGFFIAESAVTPAVPTILEHNNDTVVIETVLQEAEAQNRNKRVYAFDGLDGAINSPQFKEKIEKLNMFGECGHPLSNSLDRQTYIDQTRMSHLIKKVWWEGMILKGIVATTNTGVGRDMAGLIKQGMETAFSMRGLGGVTRKQGEITRVEKPLHIITYDWVIFPSHSNAYQTKIIKESFSNYNEQSLNEGLKFDVDMSDILSYVKDESFNIKESINHLELDSKNIILSENFDTVTFQQPDGKLVLYVEEDIQNEIRNYTSRF